MRTSVKLQLCGKCGGTLSAYAPEGLCAACLLECALDVGPGVGGDLVSPESSVAFGDYELEEEIARGGMGVVYRARQLSLNRPVAVKMILAGRLASASEIARFRTEAETAARLQHPGIVSIHEIGEHEGGQFFSMDYVEGPTLAELVRERPMPAHRAARYAKAIAEAIHYAHQRGVLHRDLKPSNVLIDREDQPRVTDFGLAKWLEGKSDLTLAGQVLGSPGFMPPEQAGGGHGRFGPASDIYSLGAILYHLLTGRPPFLAETTAAVLRMVVEGEPVSLRLLNASVPRDLETICLKCLEKDPKRRYPTARELAEELGRFLIDEPIRARPVGWAERTWRWCRRNPALAAASVAVIGLLVTVGFGSTVAATRLHRANREGQEKLREAYLFQARASRWSGRPGRRFESLDVIRKAAQIRPGLDLRNEAIAAMALADIRPAKTWRNSGAYHLFDPSCKHYTETLTNGAVHLRRVADEAVVRSWPSFGLTVNELGFSPDGQLLGAGYRSKEDFAFRLYDLAEAGKMRFEVVDVWVRTMGFSRDGRWLAIAGLANGKGSPRLWFFDAQTGGRLNGVPTDSLAYGLAFYPTGDRIAVSSAVNSNVNIYSFPGGQILQTLAHSNGVNGVSWSPDGRRLATAGVDGYIYLWDFSFEPARLRLLPNTSYAIFCYFHPQGDFLFTFGWSHLARLWRVDSGDEVFHLPADLIGPFSSGGNFVGLSSMPGVAGLADFAPGSECRIIHFEGAGQLVHWAEHSPDGKWLASAHKDGLRFRDLETGAECHYAAAGEIHAFEYTRDGRALVTTGVQGISWWPLLASEAGGKARVTVGSPIELAARDSLVSVNPAMRMLAVSSGKAWIIDQESVSCERQITLSNGVASAAISPDGLRCVTWSLKSAEVEVWDVNDGRRAATLGAGSSPCLGFSPDGRWLITGSAEEYMFWETRSWARRKTIQRGVTGGAHGKIAFTSDSRLVALAVGRGEVALFDALDFEALATLEGTEVSAVTSLSFSCDGTRLAVGTTHPSIQYWNLRLVREGLAELNLDYPRPRLPAQRVSPGAMGGPSVAGDWPSQAGLGGHDVRTAPDSRVR